MKSTSCEMLGWMNHSLESRLLGEISIISDMQRQHFNGRKWRGAKESFDESETGEWKIWLKTQHSKNEDHGIWPITSWQTDGEKVEIMTDLIFLGSKNNCSHEIKRCLLFGRKAMTNINCIKKKRHHFADKGLYKAMVFSVAMYNVRVGP